MKDVVNERVEREVKMYNSGMSSRESLMALTAKELRSMVGMMRGKPRCPRAKDEIVELLMSNMPARKPRTSVEFSEPAPVGAVGIKRRADAAVHAFRSGRPCRDCVREFIEDDGR